MQAIKKIQQELFLCFKNSAKKEFLFFKPIKKPAGKISGKEKRNVFTVHGS